MTHDADEAIALGDRLVRFARGKTSVAGDPRALLGRGDRVLVSGDAAGPSDPLGQGRARVRLRDAVIEGPEEALRGDRIALELTALPPRGEG